MKRGSKDNFFRIFFLIAAIYDLVLGVLFLFLYKQIFNYFNIAIPDYPMHLQMAAAFVIAMGVGYYFVYLNLYRNVDLVKLGVAYKFVYAGLTSYFYLIYSANVLFLWFALIDIVFLVLFVWFLVYAKKDGRYLKWV